jgi:hypothetical protein
MIMIVLAILLSAILQGSPAVSLEQCREAIQTENWNSVVFDLNEFVYEMRNETDNLSDLSVPQQIYYLIAELQAEVNNGGFDQFYFNSAGNYADETVIALKRIGADQTAELVAAANALFPKGKVPQDRNKRQKVMNKIRDKVSDDWSDLDGKFYITQAEIDSLSKDYVLANLADFLRPLPKK